MAKKKYGKPSIETLGSVNINIEIEEEPDMADSVNGISDDDLLTGPFQFTCHKRVYSGDKHGHYYLVTPDEEYKDLDFEGKTVSINGRERLCHSFKIDEEDRMILFVACD